MGKPTPRKLEKKRRDARQQAKARHEPERSHPQPYHGSKYKTDEYAGVVFQIEQAIHMAFVASQRQATDHDIRRSLEQRIERLRSGHDGSDQDDDRVGSLLTQFLPRDLPLSHEEKVGIWRTILGSIEVWGTPSPNSRGYLSFLEGFMRKAGVCCRSDAVGEMAEVEAEEGLFSIGRAWCSGEQSAGPVFKALAEQLIADGQPDQVAETCQQLIGEGPSTAIFRELSQLAIEAQRHHLCPPVSPTAQLNKT